MGIGGRVFLGYSPEDAPLRLDPQDGGILYIFIVQLLMDLGLVHSHRHLHLLKAFIGGRGVADNVLGGSPERRRNKCEPGATSSKMVPKRAQLFILMSCGPNLCTEQVKLSVNHLCSCSSVWGSGIAFSLV